MKRNATSSAAAVLEKIESEGSNKKQKLMSDDVVLDGVVNEEVNERTREQRRKDKKITKVLAKVEVSIL
jgi:hypothetical protein